MQIVTRFNLFGFFVLIGAEILERYWIDVLLLWLGGHYVFVGGYISILEFIFICILYGNVYVFIYLEG